MFETISRQCSQRVEIMLADMNDDFGRRMNDEIFRPFLQEADSLASMEKDVEEKVRQIHQLMESVNHA